MNLFSSYHTNRKKQEKNKTLWYRPKVHRAYSKKRLPLRVWEQKGNPAPFVMGLAALRAKVGSYSDSVHKVLGYMIYLDSRGIPLYMSQERIATNCGISRKTVNRVIERLFGDGFIDVYRRPNNSCVYKLTQIFRKREVQEDCGQFIPVLRSLFLCLLSAYSISGPLPGEFYYSLTGRHFRTNVPLYKNKENKNNNLVLLTPCKRDGFGSTMSKDYKPPRDVEQVGEAPAPKKGQDESFLVKNTSGKMVSIASYLQELTAQPKDPVRSEQHNKYQDLNSYTTTQRISDREKREQVAAARRRQVAELKNTSDFRRLQWAREQLREVERGTDYEKENNEQAERNLEKIFGPNWHDTI